jgi:hypothetical protein
VKPLLEAFNGKQAGFNGLRIPFNTGGAHSKGDVYPGVLTKILFNICPLLLVFPDLLAVHANMKLVLQRAKFSDVLEHQ